MTSLNTRIPIEYVKQSNKLCWEVETEMFYDCNGELTVDRQGPSCKSKKNSPGLHIRSADLRQNIPAPTIADIINKNGELFGIKQSKEYGELLKSGEYVSIVIMQKCFDDYSIEEISEYIIKNMTKSEQIEHKIDDFINKEGVSAYYRNGKKYIECRKSMLIDLIYNLLKK